MRAPWLDLIVDLEARAYQFEKREVTNSELVAAVLKSGLMPVSRDHAMRRIRETRREDWYSAAVRYRCNYVIDNPETV